MPVPSLYCTVYDPRICFVIKIWRICAKTRILSLAWGPPIPKQTSSSEQSEDSDDDDDDDWKDSWIVAGCSDSSVRRFDVVTGRVGEKMGTDKVKGERTLVWSVGVLG